MAFWIISDSGVDLPQSYIEKQENLLILPMTYEINGDVFTPSGKDEQTVAFYDSLKEGKVATTAQINAHTWKETFRPLIKQGHEVLCLPLSSGLSGTYAAALSAKAELDIEYPDNKLIVLDIRCASLGQGLMVHYAIEKRNQGGDLAAVSQWVRDHILKLVHWFTVDDLQFLRRGGRVSVTSAYIGSILKIKPVLHVDNEGHLIPIEKVQGRKKSLKTLYTKVEETATNLKDQTIFISHGDCLADAQWLANQLKENLGVKEVLISMIGPVIGSHSGPGTVAIFFLGEHR